MIKMTQKHYWILTAALSLSAAISARAGAIADAKSQSAGDVALEGVVVGRGILSDEEGFFLLQSGDEGVGIKVSGPSTSIPPYSASVKVNAQSTAADYLTAGADAISLVSTNAALPKAVIVQELGQLEAADNQFVVIPAVSLGDGLESFEGGSQVDASIASGTIPMFVSQSIDGRKTPNYDFNMFGAVMTDAILGGDGSKKVALPARLVPVYSNTVKTQVALKHTCVTCHAVKATDPKMIGPNYAWVAERYKDDPNAIEAMITQMNQGGMGKWGPIPMIPFAGRIPDDEMNQLAEWIWSARWDFLLNE